MFKRELADVLKQTVWILVTIFALPAVLLGLKILPKQPYVGVFMPLMQTGLLFWALFLGASILGRERGQRALEYALSLPYSRLGLLWRLVAPRLIVLAALNVAAWLLYGLWGPTYAAISPALFEALYVSLFIINLALAPLFENFIAQAISSLFVLVTLAIICLLLFWMGLRLNGIPLPWPMVQAARSASYFDFLNVLGSVGLIALGGSLLLPFLASLVVSFVRFDIRASAAFRWKFFKFLGIFLAAGFLASLVNIAISPVPNFRQLNLTSDAKVVEFTPFSLKIHSRSEILKVGPLLEPIWPEAERPPFVFFAEGPTKLMRLNTESGELGVALTRRGVEPMWTNIQAVGRDLVYFSRRSDGSGRSDQEKTPTVGTSTFRQGTGLHLVLNVVPAEPNSDRPSMAIPYPASGDQNKLRPRVFGTSSQGGVRSWLIQDNYYASRVFKLWQDGRYVDIYSGPKLRFRDCYSVNDLVIINTRAGLKIYRDLGDTFAFLKTLEGNLAFMTSFRRWIPENGPKVAALYGKNRDHIARLDLATLEIADIAQLKDTQGTWVWADFPKRFVLVEGDRASRFLRFSEISDSGVTLLKEFKGIGGNEFDRYELDEDGLIVRRGRHRYEAYAFPRLERLKVKGL